MKKEEITTEQKETATGTIFTTHFPKGVLNRHVPETHAIHITDWGKMDALLSSSPLNDNH